MDAGVAPRRTHWQRVKASPRTYALGYLLMIPVFAIIYVNLGVTNFAQSNLRSEHDALETERSGLAQLLATGVVSQLRDDWTRMSPDLVVIPAEVGVGDLRIESDTIMFTFYGSLARDRGPAEHPLLSYYPHSFSVDLILSTARTIVDGPGGSPLVIHELEIKDPIRFDPAVPNPPSNATLRERMESVGDMHLTVEPTGDIPAAYRLPASPGSFTFMAFSAAEENDLQFHVRALVYGDPLAVRGLTKRTGAMLYLSAATITTLGFGDITPTSPSARFWIALEAVLGVVTAGLFLNSVARRRPGPT